MSQSLDFDDAGGQAGEAESRKGDIPQSVVEALRRYIVTGKLLPNEHLVEADLARNLNTNRANIRTAFVVLEGEGLVTREPNRGARVRRVSADEALEIVQVRVALETLSAQVAAENATPQDVEKLEGILAGMRTCFAAGDFLGMSELNAQLHGLITDIANNKTLSRMLANLNHQLVRVQYRTVLMPGRAERALKEHTDIVAAIAAKDPEKAYAAMSVHLRAVRDNLRVFLKSGF
ncbi:GntR family transcriptional regulator [Terrihabitans soli]|uniref:GntR family transcriptional regulator n=1 Tax=Terrihabitans soli TaxID=708113 RepID=A0A6S6QNU0_9HYPH|nr:GntR family transcriptional regulator [Terrihabitans soli]BCJ92194.1 GntR family transcriptional regulator [Terrihabitans soli]